MENHNEVFKELKELLTTTVTGIEKQKKVTRTLHIIEIGLAILISLSVVVSWVASPVVYMREVNNRLRWVEYWMRQFHPEVKETIANPFQTRGIEKSQTYIYTNSDWFSCDSHGTDK